MPAVEVRLLGPLELDVAGRRIELRRKKQRALLAVLALHAGEVVSTERLVDELWGEKPPKAAMGSLQNLVSELRKRLPSDVLLTRAPGYTLDIGRDAVDAHRFERLANEAKEATDLEVGAVLLREAVALWRGPPLVDVQLEQSTRTEAARLEELRAAIREEQLAVELELGGHSQVIGKLEALVAEYPLREEPTRLLMLALYRAGRQGEALEAYRRVRETLVEELGIEPSRGLRDVQQAMLNQDQNLDNTRASSPDSSALHPDRRRIETSLRSTLPAQPTRLVGRKREVGEVQVLLKDHRLVTLVGPGGIGKTRLAHEIANQELARFGGVFFVPLADLTNPELVESAVALAVGVDGSLVESLHGRKILLVFDTFEHLAEAAAPRVAGLLAAIDGLTILVTSREPLRISGEHEYLVPPLANRDAEELFVERARAVVQDFQPDHHVAQVLARLDGLPLAIELATARLKILSTAMLAQGLERRLPLLTGGHRDLPERQRTLRATISWSYDLLDEAEQNAFIQCSVFEGSFGVEAAQNICGCGFDTLESLVRKSLLQSLGGDRVSFLDTIREYALERFAEDEHLNEVRQLYVAHFLSLANIESGTETGISTTAIEEEYPNFRTVLDGLIVRGEYETAFRLAARMTPYWTRKNAGEGRVWLERLLTVPSQDAHLRTEALINASTIVRYQGDEHQAVKYAEEGVALAHSDASELLPLALSELGSALGTVGEYSRAIELLKEALAHRRVAGSARDVAVALTNLGYTALLAGDVERAEQSFREGLALARSIGDAEGIAVLATNLALASIRLRKHKEARQLLRESLQTAVPLGWTPVVAAALEGASALAIETGDAVRAARLAARAETLLGNAGFEYEPYERAIHIETVGAAKEQLAARVFASAWREGATEPVELDLDKVLQDSVASIRERQWLRAVSDPPK